MSKKSKLFERLKNNPIGVTFAELSKLLSQEGFQLDRVAGSHHIFKRGALIFVVPVKNNRIKAVYVKRVIELLELE